MGEEAHRGGRDTTAPVGCADPRGATCLAPPRRAPDPA